MSVKVEKLDGLQRRLTIHLSVTEIDKVYQDHLQKAARAAKIPGFRPGKVPLKMVANRFGKEILQDVGNELMQSSLRDAIIEHKIQIAGSPQIEPFELKVGEPLEVVVHYEAYPEIQLHEIKDAQIERAVAEITENDVNKMLTELSKQNADWKTVDQASKNGDRVIIDFEGTLDGKAFEQGAAEGFQVELGSKRMIPGFEEGIVGMKAGEERDIKVTFPTDYPSPELAGKEAVFKITAHDVLQPELLEGEALAKKLGFEAEAALQADIRKNMERVLNQELASRLKMQVLDKLIEFNPIEIPKTLIESEIDYLQRLTRQQMSRSQPKDQVNKMELPREPYTEQAKKRVILGLLLAEVIKKKEIKVTPEQIRAKVEEIAATYHKPEDIISWYYNNKSMLAEVESAVLEDQVVAQLLEQLKVEEKQMTYEEAVHHESQH